MKSAAESPETETNRLAEKVGFLQAIITLLQFPSDFIKVDSVSAVLSVSILTWQQNVFWLVSLEANSWKKWGKKTPHLPWGSYTAGMKARWLQVWEKQLGTNWLKHTQTSGVPGHLFRISGLTATVICKANWGGETYEQNGLSHPSMSVLQTLLQLRTTFRAQASYYQSPGADAASRRVVN